jgi:glycine cleavage system H protein
MTTRYYTAAHEWIEIKGTTGVVGITDYAQNALGDVVFVDLPAPGSSFTAGAAAAVVESVKAASEVYAPVSGVVTLSNKALQDDPALVNADPQGNAWFFQMTLTAPEEIKGLMDEAAYQALVSGL